MTTTTDQFSAKLENKPTELNVSEPEWFKQLNLKAFAKELEQIRKEAVKHAGKEDIDHLKKIALWGRLCSLLGYILCFVTANPFSALLISLGKTSRWTMVAHHVSHKGYDKIPHCPKHYHSDYFAKGWRRYFDWFDWIYPAAWDKEHNQLHHFRLGERFDPDLYEDNVVVFRRLKLPRFLKATLFLFLAGVWKWIYYAPSTMKQLYSPAKTAESSKFNDRLFLLDPTFLPWTQAGWDLWTKSYLPYVLFHFLLVPFLFSKLGAHSFATIFFCMFLAECLTNFHTYLIITSNHAGDDLYRFSGSIETRAEFFIRQIVGSVNYQTGSDLNDFLHGWLNYQIEHHIWPDMSMLQYQKVQPKVKALCKKHQVPYVQESVFVRFRKLFDIFSGQTSMRHFRQTQAE